MTWEGCSKIRQLEKLSDGWVGGWFLLMIRIGKANQLQLPCPNFNFDMNQILKFHFSCVIFGFFFSVVVQCLMFLNFGKLHKLITEGRENREREREEERLEWEWDRWDH